MVSRWIRVRAGQRVDFEIAAFWRDESLRSTHFPPWSWNGLGLDSIHTAREGSSRVVTQFLGHLLREEPTSLVDGGRHRCCLTHVDDGIQCRMRILANAKRAAADSTFNIDPSGNDHSIEELAEVMIRELGGFPGHEAVAKRLRILEESADHDYGKEYQDILRRVPSVRRAKEWLGWEPKIGFEDALRRTLAQSVQDATLSERCGSWGAASGVCGAPSAEREAMIRAQGTRPGCEAHVLEMTPTASAPLPLVISKEARRDKADQTPSVGSAPAARLR